MSIQSILFDKRAFGLKDSLIWMKQNDKKYKRIVENYNENYRRFVIKEENYQLHEYKMIYLSQNILCILEIQEKTYLTSIDKIKTDDDKKRACCIIL